MNTWLVCGSRNINNKPYVHGKLNECAALLGFPDILIHGGAKGVDMLAGKWAGSLQIPVTVYSAQWSKYGKSAGPIRNLEMLDTNPTHVVAFIDSESRGTRHTVLVARQRGIPTTVWEY